MAEKTYHKKEIDKYIKDLTKKSGSSFYLGMRFLPKNKRNAMFAVYAFCRTVDDIADGNDDLSFKKQQLNQWKKIIESIYKGDVPADNPVAIAVAQAAREFSLPKAEFLEVIAGMEMDMDEAARAKPMKALDLELYCRRVAGAVGMLSVYVFGAVDAKSRQFALALGEAFQLTNILRDIAEDAKIGRIYLPYEVLAKHKMVGLTPKEILQAPALPLVCEEVAEKAGRLYIKAESLVGKSNRKALAPALLMMRVYRKIFVKMKRRGWKVLEPRVKLSKLGKITAALGVA